MTDAPARRGPDEMLRLVYAKAAAKRRRRRGAVSAVVVLVVGAVGASVATGGSGPARRQVTYAMPAELPAVARQEVAHGLALRFRGLGYSDAQARLGVTTVTVDWQGGDLGRSAAGQLGTAGVLSVRPVIATHQPPCRPQPADPSSATSFEVASPNQGGAGCLVVGPAELMGITFSSTSAVLEPNTHRWAVAFVVSSSGSGALDAFAARHYHQQTVILVDNHPLSAPLVNSPNFGGRGLISGNFDRLHAEALALAMRYPLPISLSLQAIS